MHLADVRNCSKPSELSWVRAIFMVPLAFLVCFMINATSAAFMTLYRRHFSKATLSVCAIYKGLENAAQLPPLFRSGSCGKKPSKEAPRWSRLSRVTIWLSLRAITGHARRQLRKLLRRVRGGVLFFTPAPVFVRRSSLFSTC